MKLTEDSTHSDLVRLVAQIPLRLRAAVKPNIMRLQRALKLPSQDLTIDRRTLRRQSDDPGRRQFQEAMEMRSQEKKTWVVQWRDSFEASPCTLEDAAKQVNRTPRSLRNVVSRAQGTWHTMIDEQIVTVSRVTAHPQ